MTKRTIREYLGLAMLMASFFAFVGGAFGQDGTQAPPPSGPGAPAEQGPAARAVRLSSVDGQVQLSQGSEVLAAQALANTPLFEGTQISTSEDGRAEVQFEDGSVARISPNGSLTLATLGQQGATLQTDLVLNSGLGYFEIQGNGDANQIRVHFGNAVATVSGFTVLRINLDYAPGEVAVFSGNAHIEGGNTLALDLHGGESVKLNGTAPGNYVVAESIEPDSWDTWNSDRDQALTAQEADRTSASSSLPNASNPAWSDLNSNGSWYNVPGQGNVWSPYAAESSSWDPYGCGSWMWTPRFGYMWVSCEPWGYMPYAFGTWNYYDGFGWGWAPGLGNPWWGGYGWGFNIGVRPVRYRPPHRPSGGPRPGNPIRFGGRYQPYPVVAVNRVHDSGGAAPIRVRNAPVTIAGNTIQPLHPVSPRPVYGSTFVGEPNHGPGVPGTVGNTVHYGYPTAPNANHPGTLTPPANTYRPPANAYRPPTTSYRPPVAAPRYSAPSHPTYSAPPSHASAPMGGGGGGGHPSGGGGSHR